MAAEYCVWEWNISSQFSIPRWILRSGNCTSCTCVPPTLAGVINLGGTRNTLCNRGVCDQVPACAWQMVMVAPGVFDWVKYVDKCTCGCLKPVRLGVWGDVFTTACIACPNPDPAVPPIGPPQPTPPAGAPPGSGPPGGVPSPSYNIATMNFTISGSPCSCLGNSCFQDYLKSCCNCCGPAPPTPTSCGPCAMNYPAYPAILPKNTYVWSGMTTREQCSQNYPDTPPIYSYNTYTWNQYNSGTWTLTSGNNCKSGCWSMPPSYPGTVTGETANGLCFFSNSTSGWGLVGENNCINNCVAPAPSGDGTTSGETQDVTCFCPALLTMYIKRPGVIGLRPINTEQSRVLKKSSACNPNAPVQTQVRQEALKTNRPKRIF